jgi:hypothetical protein
MWDDPYLVPIVVIGGFFIGVIGFLIHSVRGPSKEERFLRYGERMEEPLTHRRHDSGLGVAGDSGWGTAGGGWDGGDLGGGDGGGGDSGGH